MTPIIRMAALLLGVLVAYAPAVADPVSDFYNSRTMTIVVGSDAGGGYDTMAHLLAQRIGAFIPGHPSVIVQNMPGAGSINAANYLYNTAARDGSVIGIIQRTLLSANLTHQPGARFDIQKFNWIGNLTAEIPLLMSWHTSPVKHMSELLVHELAMGGAGPSSDSEVQARLFNALIGTKIRIISGYPGQAQIQLALERGEVEAVGGWSLANLKARVPQWLAEGKVNILLQGSSKRTSALPDVPTPFEYVRTDADRALLELFYAQQIVARPFVGPPGIPGDRLAALRDAFTAVVKDSTFLAAAAKAGVEIDATDHRSIEAVISIIARTPQDMAARFAGLNNAPN